MEFLKRNTNVNAYALNRMNTNESEEFLGILSVFKLKFYSFLCFFGHIEVVERVKEN